MSRFTWTAPRAGSWHRSSSLASINASGHKYGLVYPGVGWVVWRSPDALPGDLVFKVNYLGGEMPTFALNFSRSGANVAAQYYNFLRLGFDGYQRVQQACQDVAMHLASKIARMEPFELLSDGSDLPVFAFKIRDESAGFTVFDLSERLRTRGWILPAYTFPANMEHVAVLRVVVRNGFSKDLADLLLSDIQRHVRARGRAPAQPRAAGPGGQAAVVRALIPGGVLVTGVVVTAGPAGRGRGPGSGRTTPRSRRAPSRPAARPPGPAA
jgi:glutamate decarboxylase